MATKYFWIGSTGPFAYDDTAKSNDSNLVYDGAAAPDQQAVASNGRISVFDALFSGLSASKLVSTDGSNVTTSADASSFVGGSGGITATDNGDGTVTLSGGGGSAGSSASKTISGGAIAISNEFHVQLTGEGDAADDLTSITGGSEGDKLVLRGKTAIGYTVTVKDGATLHLQADFGINSEYDTLYLLNIGSDHWVELSRANNA